MADEQPATVLVVDDNVATRYTTSRFLRAAGFRVMEAGTGGEAIGMAAEGVDMLVLDVNLPDIDGFEVCRQIRARETVRRMPIIHLSATFVADVDKVHGLDSGADGYLTHPVEPPVLVATVKAFLRAREAEEGMRRSEEKFRAVFDQALNGISLLSNDLVYLELNDAMCQILGRPREEIIGKHNSAFVPQGYEDDVAAVSRALEQGKAWRGTLPLIRADGQLVELEWSVSDHSSPGVRLAIVNDITGRKAVEAERERLLASERAARVAAEDASRLKDEFLATLSHELRTPLNAIVGWSQVLARQGMRDPQALEEGLDAIARNARSQSQLIDDLLDMNRIISGKLSLNVTRVRMSDLVHAAIGSVRHAADVKQVALEVELGAGLNDISGDPARLQQVLWNLLSNAIKFTPKGGKVEIIGEPVDSQICLKVIDSGEGIEPDFLPYVFDRFRQADATTTRRHGGLGLGLSIAKSLVELHGGTISATSPGRGQGATFQICLPVAAVHEPVADRGSHPPSAKSPDEKAPPDAMSLDGLKLLVVDDEADARRLLKRVFSDHGGAVTLAVSAFDALELARRERYDIIISDIGMPQMDGYALMRQIREMPGERDRPTPAIALTAFARPDDRARALAAGYQIHTAKPVIPADLVSLVANLARP